MDKRITVDRKIEFHPDTFAKLAALCGGGIGINEVVNYAVEHYVSYVKEQREANKVKPGKGE